MSAPSRLARRFAQLRAEGRAGLVTFTMAGDPDLETARAILMGLPKAGADVVELGVPFTDPMADGPAIQAAGLRALKAGTRLQGVLDLARSFRAADPDTPLVLMGYCNPVYRFGADAFAEAARAAGVDGLIIVDLPPEEDSLLGPAMRARGLDMIRLVAPTTPEERLPIVLGGASGFVYYVAITGITGTRAAEAQVVAPALQRLHRHTALPVAVGFGIRTPDQAAAIAAQAEGVVVGSALVDAVGKASDADGAVRGVHELVRGLSTAIRTVKRAAAVGTHA